MAGFQRFHYSVADEPAEGAPDPTARRGFPPAERGGDETPEGGFDSDEAAARYHLSRLLEREPGAVFGALAAAGRPERVPDLKLVDVQALPRANRLVRFEQAHAEIPIFGSRVVCELDERRRIVAAQASVAEVRGAPTIATISAADALQRIAEVAEVSPESLGALPAPRLSYFLDAETRRWHLVHVFEKVPAAPPPLRRAGGDHGLGPSPRSVSPRVTYLVDANDGEVVYHFSATPFATVPTQCKGIDELSRVVTFWGCVVGDQFELRDPHYDVVTHDLGLADIENPPPVLERPVRSSASDWATTNRAAVSAHANAGRVSRFYKAILARDGIDNKGMELVNVVNCTYRRAQDPPVWENAVWYDDRMWYGQARDEEGRLASFSRHLDVIAHEVTHGLTERTAGLVYRDEPGALNESFSDIFGVMIKNWDFGDDGGGDVAGWNWEIGSGLGRNGLPLRDVSDPGRTRDPAHYDDRYTGDRDEGGVHINSNIHNKAAYHLLTAADEGGARRFSPADVAILYYYCLLSLDAFATFADALSTLLHVTSTVYAGEADGRREARLAAVQDAYAAVGIRTSP